MSGKDIVSKAINELISTCGLGSKENEIKDYIFNQGNYDRLFLKRWTWDYKLAIKVCKPVFEILENADKDSDDYQLAYKFLKLTYFTASLNIDGPFYKMMQAYMAEGLTFFGATLLDLAVTNFSKNANAIKYQLSMAEKCRNKDPNLFQQLFENLMSVDQSFINSSSRITYYYYSFIFGFIGEMCNNPKIEIVFEEVIGVLNNFEKAIDSEILENLDKAYTNVITNICFKYFNSLYIRLNKNEQAFAEAVKAAKDSVIPYRYQLEAFALSGKRDSLIDLAEQIVFEEAYFNAEIYTQKTIESLPPYVMKKANETALNKYGNGEATINTLLYTTNENTIERCSADIYASTFLRTMLKKRFADLPRLRKSNKTNVDNLIKRIEEYEIKTAKMKLHDFDEKITKNLTLYNAKTFDSWRADYAFRLSAESISEAIKALFKMHADNNEFAHELFLRFGVIFSNVEYLRALRIANNEKYNQDEFNKSLICMVSNDEYREAIFGANKINEYPIEDYLYAVECLDKNPSLTTIVLNGLFFASSKKEIAFCEKLINENYEFYEKTFISFQEKYTKLKKDNEIVVKAIIQKNSNEIVVFNSSEEVESFAKNETLTYAKVLDGIDFTKFSPVTYKDGHAVSVKTLKVLYDKYFAMTELYRLSLCDSMVKTFHIDSFRTFIEEVFNFWARTNYDSKIKALSVPYCFYTSNQNLVKLKKECKTLCEANKHAVTVYLITAMAMNGSKYALMLVDNMGSKFPFPKSRQTAKDAIVTAAKKYKMSVDQLGDLIVPDYDFDQNGMREFAYNGAAIILKLMPDGVVKILKDGKEIKTLPNPQDEESKLVKDEISALKKEIKTVLALQSARLENNLMTGYARAFGSFKKNILGNPTLKGLASSLIWGVYTQEGELLKSFRYGLDATLTDYEYNEVSPSDSDIIALIHPSDLKSEALTAWRDYLSDNEITQPFVQMNQNVLFVNKQSLVKNEVKFAGVEFKLSMLNKLVSRFNMVRLPVVDAGGYEGFYLENTENNVGVDILLEGLYIGCETDEGENLSLGFYKPSESKMEYSNHNEYGSYLNPDEVPTRFMSTLLNSLQKISGDLQFLSEGNIVKVRFTVPKNVADLSFDEEPVAEKQQKPIVLTPVIKEKPAEKPEEKITVKAQPLADKAKKIETTPATVTPPSAGLVYLEFVEGTSSKFWQIDVVGNSHTVTYGRIGTAGVAATKSFADNAQAESDAKKLIHSKTAKGYVIKQKQ